MISNSEIAALIVDDEKQSRNALKSQLQLYCPHIQIIGEAHGYKDALEKINSLQPQLVFLDIELGDGNGFQVLKETVWKKFKTIFITAFNQYAITAFKFSAIDYLLKPIAPHELIASVERAHEQVQSVNIASQLLSLQKNLGADSKTKKLVLKDAESFYVIKVSDIVLCEAEGAYTRFYLSGGKQILISKGLKEYEELLAPSDFIRTHHSYLINTDKIVQFDKAEGGVVLLEEGHKAPVSQRKREQLLQLFNKL